MLSRISKNTINLLALTSLCILFSGQANADAIEPVYTGEKPSLPYTPGIKLKNGMLFISGQIAYVKDGIPDYAIEDDFVRFLRERLESYSPDKGAVAYLDQKHDGRMRAYYRQGSKAIRAIGVGRGAIYGTKLIHLELT